jgi:hypothetical protein
MELACDKARSENHTPTECTQSNCRSEPARDYARSAAESLTERAQRKSLSISFKPAIESAQTHPSRNNITNACANYCTSEPLADEMSRLVKLFIICDTARKRLAVLL